MAHDSSRIGRLIALVVSAVIVFLAGCGGSGTLNPDEQQTAAFDDLRAVVERAVVDSDNEAEIIELVDILEGEINALRDSKKQQRAEFRRLNADYDASREELSAFAEEIEASLQENRLRLIEARNLLVETTTEEQWALIMEAETEAMRALLASLRLL